MFVYVFVQVDASLFRIHAIPIDVSDLPFKPPRATIMQELRDPIGAALSVAYHCRITGAAGQHIDWGQHGEAFGLGELSASEGVRQIRASLPEGARALIINLFSDKSDVDKVYVNV